MALVPSTFRTGPRTNIFDPFSTDLWDPFTDIFPLTTSSALTPATRLGFGPSDEVAQLAATRIDWRETPDAHIFKADIPGLRKDEVKVEVEEGGVLRISGERSREEVEVGDTWHRMERSSGSFLRRFRLPDNARVDEVKASLENGVLTVTVPKIVKTPEVKSIQITG